MRNKYASNLIRSVLKRFGAIVMAVCVTTSMGCFDQKVIKADTEQTFVGTANHLEVVANGDEDQYGSTVVKVNPGEVAELSVTVTADNMEGLTYEWTYSENGTEIVLEASTEKCTTPQIEKTCSYYCKVTDCYGNSKKVSFNVQVENHLKTSINGKGMAPQILVGYGEDVDLYLTVTADNMEGMKYSWWDPEDNKISSTDKCTISNVTKPGMYGYMIIDCYGNATSIYFGVGIENHLNVNAKVYANDVDVNASNTESDDYYQAMVNAGETVKLLVNAEADNTQCIMYEWYALDNGSFVGLDSTSDTCVIDNIQNYTKYYCQIIDFYNNVKTITFEVGIQNHFKVSGNESAEGVIDIRARQGEDVVLSIAVEADNMHNLKYEWGQISGTIDNDSDTYIVNNIQKSGIYYCAVTDCYGNKKSIEFDVSIENHLQVYANDEEDNYFIGTVEKGEKIDLSVRVAADNTQNLRYLWFHLTNDEHSGKVISTSDSYTTDNLQKYETYYCNITDCYGNQKTAWFYIGIENNLKVYANGKEKETKIELEEGGSTELNVAATADNDSNLKYEWYYWNPATDETATLKCTDSHYTVTNAQKYLEYYCTVTDYYGNKDSAMFYVYVNADHLTANGSTEPEVKMTVSKGEDVTFTIGSEKGKETAYTYLWRDFTSGEGVKLESKSSVCKLQNIQEDKYIVAKIIDPEFGNIYAFDYYITVTGNPHKPDDSSNNTAGGTTDGTIGGSTTETPGSGDNGNSGSNTDNSGAGTGSAGDGNTSGGTTGTGNTDNGTTGGSADDNTTGGTTTDGSTTGDTAGGGSTGGTSVSGGSTGASTTTDEKKDDGKTDKKVTTNKDGSVKEVVKEKETNSKGKEVTVTTTTEKDKKGKVTNVTEKAKIDNIASDASATVTVKTDKKGNVTATASVEKKVASEKKTTTISSSMIEQIKEAAGTDVDITMTVKDEKGNTKYKVKADTADLKKGKDLYIYKLNTKTGEYVMVNDKTYAVSDKGNVSVKLDNKGTYELVSATDAKKIEKKILATVQAKKTTASVKKGKKTSIALSSKLNMSNVKSITYSTDSKSVATVSKKGTVTAKGKGTTTIKATVTLKNGKTKTVKMKVTVK